MSYSKEEPPRNIHRNFLIIQSLSSLIQGEYYQPSDNAIRRSRRTIKSFRNGEEREGTKIGTEVESILTITNDCSVLFENDTEHDPE